MGKLRDKVGVDVTDPVGGFDSYDASKNWDPVSMEEEY